jgi:hypothetical protein
LIDKLCTKEEIEGLLTLVIERLPRVFKEGIGATNCCIADNYAKYILSSDPIRAFVEEHIQWNSDKRTSKSEMYDSYTRFCKGKKLTVESEQSFSRRMTRKHKFEYKQCANERGRSDYYWMDITLKEKDTN